MGAAYLQGLVHSLYAALAGCLNSTELATYGVA